MSIQQAILDNDYETFVRLHKSGCSVKSIASDNITAFFVNNKAFKSLSYLVRQEYGGVYGVKTSDLLWIDLKDSDISRFLLMHPEVWRSGYENFSKSYALLPCVDSEIAQLRKEVADLKEKVFALWYSPDMPGSVIAKEHFEDLVQQA